MPAAQLKSVPPSRSAEREKLAGAIKAHADAVASLSRVSRAKEEAAEVTYRALTALERAQAALEDAKRNEGSRLAALALGEQTDTLSIAGAELAVTQAANDRTVAKNTLAALETREVAEQRAVETALRTRDDAKRDVVWAEAAKRLAAEQDEANRRLADLSLVFNRLTQLGCNPMSRWGFDQQAGSPVLADQWQVAIERLKTDADAPLPTG